MKTKVVEHHNISQAGTNFSFQKHLLLTKLWENEVQWDKIKSYVKDLFFDRNSSNFI
jgi:hypothetical protein